MAQTGSGEAVMHALSHALGIAIARLDVQATIADAPNYAEEARSRLGLDTEIMAAAMMIAQSLIMEDHLAWHASLTIGYSTGAKLLCDDRFFLSDICDYLTDACVPPLSPLVLAAPRRRAAARNGPGGKG